MERPHVAHGHLIPGTEPENPKREPAQSGSRPKPSPCHFLARGSGRGWRSQVRVVRDKPFISSLAGAGEDGVAR